MVTVADRRLMAERDRLAVCAELLELVQHRSQPELARVIGVSQNAISKALRNGDVGPVIADELIGVLGTSREALRRKHAAVIAGAPGTEPPWQTWLKMDRKRGNRTDLLTVADGLGVPGIPAPASDLDQLEGARAIMGAWGWPAAATASAEANCRVTNPRMDAREIAVMWDRWLRRRPSPERSPKPDGSPAPSRRRKDRRAGQ